MQKEEKRKAIQNALSKAYKEHGAFFAFSDKQFDEQKDPNLTPKDYTHIFAGLVCPKNNADKLIQQMRKIAPAK